MTVRSAAIVLYHAVLNHANADALLKKTQKERDFTSGRRVLHPSEFLAAESLLAKRKAEMDGASKVLDSAFVNFWEECENVGGVCRSAECVFDSIPTISQEEGSQDSS